MKNETAIRHFWNKVKKSDGCWEWQGKRMLSGYGQMMISRKYTTTHRFSYELLKGEIPKGLHVCHKCDNPPCVNPEHLFVATASENHLDMWRKGRGQWGQKNGKSILTLNKVRKIRSEYKGERGSITKIANKYGITHSAISNIVNNKSWIER